MACRSRAAMRAITFILASTITLIAQSPVVWEYDLAKAQKRAQKEGKPLFVDVWAEWCPPCQHLKRNVFPSVEAQKALAGYVPVTLMTETRDRRPMPDGMKVAMQYKVEAYPTLLILDAKGNELKRQVGAFSTGAQLGDWLKRK